MVYESDFYTTRRPYSRPNISSYSVTRRTVDWSRHPTVPRPSQVPPPITAFGKTRQPLPPTPVVRSSDAVVRVPLPVRVHRRVHFDSGVLGSDSVIRRY